MHSRLGLTSSFLLSVVLASSTACDDAPPPEGSTLAPNPPVLSVPEPPSTTPAPPPPPAPIEQTPTPDQVTEQYGVFVSPTGRPGAEGTRADPFARIAEAIATGKTKSRHVFVCSGVYRENVVLARGISVFGGYDCSAWTKGESTQIQSPTSPAMTAADIDIPTRVEGFRIQSPDGTTEAPSSIALLVKNGKRLTIANGTIDAGMGARGVNGVEGIQLRLLPNGTGAVGEARSGVPIDTSSLAVNQGGAGGVGTCHGAEGFDSESGGRGGNGGSYLCDSVTFRLTLVVAPTAGEIRSEAKGQPGLNGPSSNGGTLTPDGFQPGNGGSGTNGTPGKGGSGGAGVVIPNQVCNYSPLSAAGSGGGAGGCPGLAGTPGTGGGASIAALVSNSEGVTFDGVELHASAGGNAGLGTFGSAFTPGGIFSGGSSYGRPGGDGGASGVSGSGAGGPSYGIAYRDGAPKLVNNSFAKAREGGSGAPLLFKMQYGPKEIAPSAGGDSKDLVSF